MYFRTPFVFASYNCGYARGIRAWGGGGGGGYSLVAALTDQAIFRRNSARPHRSPRCGAGLPRLR